MNPMTFEDVYIHSVLLIDDGVLYERMFGGVVFRGFHFFVVFYDNRKRLLT